MPGKRGPTRQVITQRHIAEAFGVHRNTVANWIEQGRLKGLTLADIVAFAMGKNDRHKKEGDNG